MPSSGFGACVRPVRVEPFPVACGEGGHLGRLRICFVVEEHIEVTVLDGSEADFAWSLRVVGDRFPAGRGARVAGCLTLSSFPAGCSVPPRPC
jgi:hypothetical protein